MLKYLNVMGKCLVIVPIHPMPKGRGILGMEL